MKKLEEYIREDHKFLVKSKPKKQEYKYFPEHLFELMSIIEKRIKKEGPNCDLNDIDVSKITDMTNVFCGDENNSGDALRGSFNGDISNWDVSNVKTMFGMFDSSKFTGDISGWDVSNVKDMDSMFYDAKFNGDISGWDVSNVEDMRSMFACSVFNGDISGWDVSRVKFMQYMFEQSKFNGNLDKWNAQNVVNNTKMFVGSPLQNKLPKWYKEK